MISCSSSLASSAAGHILESDFLLLGGQQLGPALPERKGLVAAALHLPHEEDPDSDQQQKGDIGDQSGQPGTL